MRARTGGLKRRAAPEDVWLAPAAPKARAAAAAEVPAAPRAQAVTAAVPRAEAAPAPAVPRPGSIRLGRGARLLVNSRRALTVKVRLHGLAPA